MVFRTKTDRWIENGKEQTCDLVDPDKFGEHDYDEEGTSDCKHFCGCWAGPARSGGPVNPFGRCPKNPITPEKRMVELHKDARDLNDRLEKDFKTINNLENKVKVLLGKVELHGKECRRLRKVLSLHESKAAGEYWVWQGDGNDHLESLSGAVLIQADDLRILKEKSDA